MTTATNRDQAPAFMGITPGKPECFWRKYRGSCIDGQPTHHYIGPDPLDLHAPESAALVGYLMEAMAKKKLLPTLVLHPLTNDPWVADIYMDIRDRVYSYEGRANTPYAAIVAAMRVAGLPEAKYWEDVK